MENAGREARKAVSELTDVPGRPKSAMGTLPGSSDAGGAAFQLQQDYLAAGAWARLSAANPGGRPQKILLDCLQLVFDVRSAFFFYYDPVPHALIGRPCRNVGRDRSIDRMALPVRNEGSLVSRSFLDQNILDSFGYLKETSLAITDEQVIRLLGTDGMICLPMTFRSNPVGIVLAGIDEPQYPSISVHLERLRQIAALCAVLYGNSGSALFARRSESATGFVKDAPSLQKIVHEVNNPLGIVRTYLKLIAGKFDGTPDVREEIGVIEEEMERVRRLIGQLSPAETPELFPVQPLGLDFNGVLRNLSRILERSILNPANIRIHFHLAPDLPPYPGERSGIIQIFINLIKNAVEAMPGGGNIYVETRRLGQAGGGDGLCVTVRDDGPGIPQAIIDSLFEPGKTTKGIQHSGLGLSIVRDIVKRLSGKVACASCAGAGTTVRIDLPFEAEGLDRPSGG
jgi:signal transduction histidine kinase